MAELSYESIREMLDGDVFGAAIDEDGEHVILQAERIGEETELVYTATWESKRERIVWYPVESYGRRVTFVWYVKHVYHEDGTVEELFDHEEVA